MRVRCLSVVEKTNNNFDDDDIQDESMKKSACRRQKRQNTNISKQCKKCNMICNGIDCYDMLYLFASLTYFVLKIYFPMTINPQNQTFGKGLNINISPIYIDIDQACWY